MRYQGRAMGPAIPHWIGRHVHRKARPDIDPPPPAPTGIDYLHLIETAHTTELAQRLRYDQLGDPHDNDPHDRADAALEAELAEFADLLHHDGQLPGQLTLPDCPEPAEPAEPGRDSAGRAS